MAASTEAQQRGTGATRRLDFEVIDARAAEILGIDKASVTNQLLADTFGLGDRTAWWRYRTGRVTPTFDTALEMAKVIGITVEQLTGGDQE